MQNIAICQNVHSKSKKSSRDITNINGQVTAHVGDAELETEFNQNTTDTTEPNDTTDTTEPNDTTDTTEPSDTINTTNTTTLAPISIENLIIYKRDFIILHVFESGGTTTDNDVENIRDRTNYTTYCVYALLYIGAFTQVMTLNIPRYSEIAILDMYESSLNPYDVINIAYQYQTSRSRTTILKRSNNSITIPRRDFLNNLDLMQIPSPDNLLSTDVNYDEITVPAELIDLAILIRSNNYISNVNRDKLLEFAMNITIF